MRQKESEEAGDGGYGKWKRGCWRRKGAGERDLPRYNCKEVELIEKGLWMFVPALAWRSSIPPVGRPNAVAGPQGVSWR